MLPRPATRTSAREVRLVSPSSGSVLLPSVQLVTTRRIGGLTGPPAGGRVADGGFGCFGASLPFSSGSVDSRSGVRDGRTAWLASPKPERADFLGQQFRDRGQAHLVELAHCAFRDRARLGQYRARSRAPPRALRFRILLSSFDLVDRAVRQYRILDRASGASILSASRRSACWAGLTQGYAELDPALPYPDAGIRVYDKSLVSVH